MIDPTYLPFPIEQFSNHFAPVGNKTGEEVAQNHVVSYLASAQRYRAFLAANPDRRGLAYRFMQFPCQIEKDENFWTAACLMAHFYAADRAARLSGLLQAAFPDGPPLVELGSWTACLDGELRLYFRASLPSPPSYRDWLTAHLEEQQFIPYIRHAARGLGDDHYRGGLEGPTEVDALLLNATNGFAVIFEAKVCSDVSCGVTYDLRRNQIARNIDVMLGDNRNLARPLSNRRPDRSLFVLLTPQCFKEEKRRSARLYGWLMDVYRDAKSPKLAEDLSHRTQAGQDWPSVKKRLGWLTWEDCQCVLPGSCAWL